MVEAEKKVEGIAGQWNGSLSTHDIVKYTDRSGNVLSYQLFEGVNISRFFDIDFLKKIKDYKFRPDDIYLPGFPRTGTNWTNEIARMLLSGKAESIQGGKPHIEMTPEDDLEKLPSPRVINAHMRMSEAPDDIKEKKCMIIFTLRDPRDVAVSMYKITAGNPWSEKPYNGSFDDYLHLFLEGKVDYNGIFSHWRAAEKFFDENPDIPVHIQVYEETIQDPIGSAKKLSDFLGLERDDDLCKAIADKCEFAKMKSDKDPYTMKVNGVDIIFRQGKSGDWENYFSEDQLAYYYEVYEDKMAGSRFYDMYARKN